MDLLGSIMGSMDKPPTPSEREKKMQKALQARSERHKETEQRRRASFRKEVQSKVKELLSDDGDKTQISFPKMPKVYRAILHDVAEAAGLFSHSEGDGDDKDVFITKEPHSTTTEEAENKKSHSTTETSLPMVTPPGEAPPTATPPASDYRRKYQHLIGGLECAEKTAVKMEPNRSFGYVPSANKRDHRSIEETMNQLRTKKKPRLDPAAHQELPRPPRPDEGDGGRSTSSGQLASTLQESSTPDDEHN